MLTVIQKKISAESPKEVLVFPDPWHSSLTPGPGPGFWSSPDSGMKFLFGGTAPKTCFSLIYMFEVCIMFQPSLKGIYKE